MTTNELIADYVNVGKLLAQHIRAFEAGFVIHPVGKNSATETAVWLGKLKIQCAAYEAIVADLRGQADNA